MMPLIPQFETLQAAAWIRHLRIFQSNKFPSGKPCVERSLPTERQAEPARESQHAHQVSGPAEQAQAQDTVAQTWMPLPRQVDQGPGRVRENGIEEAWQTASN